MDGPEDADGGQADENVLLDPTARLDGEAPDTLAPTLPSPNTDGMTDGHNKPQRANLFVFAAITVALVLWAVGASPSKGDTAFLPRALPILAMISVAVFCLMTRVGGATQRDEHAAPLVWTRHRFKPDRYRQALEVMLLAGWVLGIVRWVAFDLHDGGHEEEGRDALVWLHLFSFTFSTLPFVALFSNHNRDKPVLSFLLKDFQFQMAAALTLWIIIVHCWGMLLALVGEEVTFLRRLSVVVESACVWWPLVGIITVDVIKEQSAFFRCVAPVLIVAFLGTASVTNSYSSYHQGVTVLFNITNIGFAVPVMATAEGQVGQWSGTLLFLLIPHLWAMVKDPHNEYVCFAIQLKMTREMASVAMMLPSGNMEVIGHRLVAQLRDKVGEMRVDVGWMEAGVVAVDEAEEGVVVGVVSGDGRETPLLSTSERDVMYAEDAAPQQKQQQPRALRGAAVFGAIGGLVGVYEAAAFLYYTKLCSGWQCYTDTAQISGFFCGFLLFGTVGLCCLPSSAPLSRRPRVVLEVLVVTGWVGMVYFSVLYTFLSSDVFVEMRTLNIICLFFFFISPLPFSALCWNNMDTSVLRLLARQTQYWTVLLLVAGLMGVKMWGWFGKEVKVWAPFVTPSDWQSFRPLYEISLAILLYSPYVVILFLDALRSQSTPFRLALPVLYLSYAALRIIKAGYTPYTAINYPSTLVTIPGNVLTHGHPVVLTNLGLLTSMNNTILFLMAGFLHAQLSSNGCFCRRGGGGDGEGGRSTLSDAQQVICFPIKVRIRRCDVGDVCVVRGKVDLSSVMDEVRLLSEQVVQLEGRKSELVAGGAGSSRSRGLTVADSSALTE